MNITGTTRVFFILGDPVAQVRAPDEVDESRRGAPDTGASPIPAPM